MKKIISLILFIGISGILMSQDTIPEGMVILGSSHAYYMNWDKLNIETFNSSVPEFNSIQLYWTMPQSVILINPEFCLLQTGPEDLMEGTSVDKVLENVSKINHSLTEVGIKLIILSGIENPEKRGVYKIKDLNNRLTEWCFENDVLFINISNITKNKNAFDKEFHIIPKYQNQIQYLVNRSLSKRKKEELENNILEK